MVNPSTAKALADRSEKAARVFDYWRKRLIEEMTARNIPAHPNGEEEPNTMLIKRSDARVMFDEFKRFKEELETFSRKLK